jgi:hypothetical protein
MTDQSAAGRKAEMSFQIHLTETTRLTLDAMCIALSRTEAAEDREREIDFAVRLGTIASKLTHAFVKLREEERELC